MNCKVKVLIVENNRGLEARELKRIVVSDGYEVVGIAETGHAAVDMAQLHRPAIVLMDIGLNDGVAAGAVAAREIQDRVGSQIIFISGSVTKDNVELWKEILKTPGHQFISKPCDRDRLLTMMRGAVVKASAKRTVFLCYSRRDQKYGVEWQEFMYPYRDVGIDSWADVAQIPLGGQWREVLEKSLRGASAAVCLVSIRFVNSAFIRDVEWPVIREAGKKRAMPVVPVFVGRVDSETLQRWGILDFQGANHPDDPISLWSVEKRARDCWVPLCERLRARV